MISYMFNYYVLLVDKTATGLNVILVAPCHELVGH